MNNILKHVKEACYGCGSCAFHCSRNAISMHPDLEGFIRPVVSDACIGCGVCLQYCPIKNTAAVRQEEHNAKIVSCHRENDEETRLSSSGGAGYSLMKTAIDEGYTVFGVEYDPDFKGCHYACAERLAQISAFRGTKYIQASKDKLYQQIQNEISKGKKILFTGLPCEVAAVKLSFANNCDKIVFVELVCHGVTSPLVASQYITSIEKKLGQISSFNVREKKYGWTPPVLKTKSKSSKEYICLFDSTEYGYAFRNFSRPSCYLCEYKGDNRAADITIGDFWGAEASDSYWNENGLSIVFVHSRNGQQLFEKLTGIVTEKILYEKAIKSNSLINKPKDKGIRDQYRDAFVNSDIFNARKKTETIREHVIRVLRNIKYKCKGFKTYIK